jgi:hypothetical protein
MELCACPDCGLPAEVVTDAEDVERHELSAVSRLVGVRCIDRHWFFGLRDRLVA